MTGKGAPSHHCTRPKGGNVTRHRRQRPHQAFHGGVNIAVRVGVNIAVSIPVKFAWSCAAHGWMLEMGCGGEASMVVLARRGGGAGRAGVQWRA